MEYKFYKATTGAFVNLVKKSISDNEVTKKGRQGVVSATAKATSNNKFARLLEYF